MIAQRRVSAQPRAAAPRARAARAIRAGSTPASAFAFSVAWIRSEASISRASASSADGEAVELRVARRGARSSRPARAASTRSSGHASRSRISRCSASSSGAASVEELTGPAGRAAPPGSSRSAGGRSRRRSWRLHLREHARRGARAASSRIQLPLLGGREAIAREQLLLLRDRRRAGDLPAHHEALEEELDRALPRVLAGEDVAARDLRVLQRGSRASARRAAPAREPCSSRYSVSARGPLAAAVLLRHRRDGSVPGRAQAHPTRETCGRGERVLPGRLAAAAAARSARRAALQRVGAAGRRRDRARRHGHARPRLDGQPRARALQRTGHGVERRQAGRDHPRPHRPLRAGAADRRARGLRGLDAPGLEAARRTSDLDRTIEVALLSGVPEEPLRRWAERRRGTGSGQYGDAALRTATCSPASPSRPTPAPGR